MERKTKYITFHIKECSDLYECRTCSPYKYPDCSKHTVVVRKVLCNYKKIITKNCRVNDILKFMNTDLRFPTNSAQYINLLIEATENSTSFFNSLSLTNGNNQYLRILRLAYFPIQENYRTIQSLLYSELEGEYSSHIKIHAKNLKLNFLSCIQIIEDINNIAEDWMTNHVVLEYLQNYVNNLRTICSFIYLITLKKRSTVVHKMLLTVPYRSSEHYTCSLCGQIEADCRCFSDLASTSYRNHDEDDNYFSPEVDKNDDIENLPHCSKNAGHAEIEDADFWRRYLENYECDGKKSKRHSQESSSDTD